MMWGCHVDYSDKGGYDLILGMDIFTVLVLNLKFSEYVIEADYAPLKRFNSTHGFFESVAA